ncbi:Protein tas [bioreactor metagenome]|uniref:Protein tas n=1 Tax=bioreactor metagenome TaxID=1076179 RepID=A0A644ZAP3_9ZZZZ
MNLISLGQSDLKVTPICLGTMTFGAQVDEPTARAILSHSLARGVNFIDTAEMYAVPTCEETAGSTETFIGNWFAANPGVRQRVVLASKVAGPSRATPWIREGAGMTAGDIIASCEGSLKRLQTDVIDLYQIHWPERHVPAFGQMYYNPQKEMSQTPIEEQLRALDQLVRAGKIRYVGLSNETPYGVHEFVRLAEQAGLPRVVSVQNPYSLLNRSWENAMDESCHRLGVSLLAYSPMGYGLLSGKYDASGTTGPNAPATARLTMFESMRKQRWGRKEAWEVGKLYNQLARDNGLAPAQMALAFCYTKWQVASTILGVTSVAQLDEDIDIWGTTLSPELLQAIDDIRKQHRDPAQ